MNLDPGAGTPQRQIEHGDAYARAVRAILDRHRRALVREELPVTPEDDAWRDVVRRANPSGGNLVQDSQ